MSVSSSFRFPQFDSPLLAPEYPISGAPRSPPPERIIRNINLHPRTMGFLDSTKKLCYAPSIKTALSKRKGKAVGAHIDADNDVYFRYLRMLADYEKPPKVVDKKETIPSVVDDMVSSLAFMNQIFVKTPKLNDGLFVPTDSTISNSEEIDFHNSFSFLVTFDNSVEAYRSSDTIGYRARHRFDNNWYFAKTAVIQKISDEFTSSNRSNVKLLRELKALSGINHQNIVRYFASWLEQCSFVLQLEYFIGESLYYFLYSTNRRVRSDVKTLLLTNKISELAAVEIIHQIGAALCFLHHECRIIHNAIEPSHIALTHNSYNLLFNGTNTESVRSMIYQCLLATRQPQDVQFKLIGFGHSFSADGESVHHCSNYLPPLSGRVKTAEFWMRRDVHALGMTVIHAMSGAHQFSRKDVLESGTRALHIENDALRRLLNDMVNTAKPTLTAEALVDL